MNRRRILLPCSVIEAMIVVAAIYFEPTCRVRGTLWREATFEGKHTSWWRRELMHWEVHGQPSMGYFHFAYERRSTALEDFRDRWFPVREIDENAERRLVRMGMRWLAHRRGPTLLRGDEAAQPVLRELLQDSSPKIRRLARIGLGMDPDVEGAKERGDAK